MQWAKWERMRYLCVADKKDIERTRIAVIKWPCRMLQTIKTWWTHPYTPRLHIHRHVKLVHLRAFSYFYSFYSESLQPCINFYPKFISTNDDIFFLSYPLKHRNYLYIDGVGACTIAWNAFMRSFYERIKCANRQAVIPQGKDKREKVP